MMKRTIVLTGLLAVVPFAYAQFVGPGAKEGPTSVKAVLDAPIDDQYVNLRGKVVRQVGKEKYMFTDGTGEIRVEIDDEVFARRQVSPDTLVEIHGEVEKDFLQSPEIDVDRLIILDGGSSPAAGTTSVPAPAAQQSSPATP